ncbi:hypothetical protein XELAEV_18014019mg [Xenopus laevis]|uniref:Cyclic nucleotide-binding domain-containing protein n=1 Tax=Xenopus laevis TaxID=8355 RepID=A0A974DT12_XENLA|nr:hypothetical protein XELAEV_18014019mg [Xenopus laevis]
MNNLTQMMSHRVKRMREDEKEEIKAWSQPLENMDNPSSKKRSFTLDPSGNYLDYLSDDLYVMDIIANFHTGFLEEGILVSDHHMIARRYLFSSRFRWDLLSVLPTDFFYFKLGIHNPCETRIPYRNAFRICKLMAYIFVVIHWNSCVYFALSSFIGFGKDDWVHPNTSDPDFGRLGRQYRYSFYFSTLIFTTVEDIPPPMQQEEWLFMVVDFFIAVLGFVNRSVKKKVIAWHQHLQIYKKLTKENQILQNLLEKPRVEVAGSVHFPILSKVQIFQNCEKSLLEELVLKLKPQVYSPGEYVCKKGDIGREMYIIKEGKLAVVADDGVTQFAVLGEGNYFGEISILNIRGNTSGNRRTANIQSIGYSDLFCLSKEDLRDALTEYPDAKAILEQKGQEILFKMNKLNEKLADELAIKEQELEMKVGRLESNFDSLQTKLARLMAELESSAVKMTQRIRQLEWEISLLENEAPGDTEADGK